MVRARHVPYLRPGDRLSAKEFERRFDATPDLKKAELIDGVVYVPPPQNEWIGSAQFALAGLLGIFYFHTPPVQGAIRGMLRLDDRNRLQPDVYLYIRAENGGRIRTDADGFMINGPELAADIVGPDRHEPSAKIEPYRRYGVQEFIVWRVMERSIEWHALHGERYEAVQPDANGVLRSREFPGLWITTKPLIEGDMSSAAGILNDGLASAEHASFVRRLREASHEAT